MSTAPAGSSAAGDASSPAAPLAVVAGATGQLGTQVARVLLQRGWRVRALVRDAARAAPLAACGAEAATADVARDADLATLERALAGADAVISCIGAPLSVRDGALRDRRSFGEVDRDGTLRLVRAARGAGAGRFVYVSLAGGPALRHTAYVAAHEAVVDALAAGPTPHAVVRPTGFFSAFDEILLLARAGRAVLVGDGSARTNPIHPADVAEVCAAAAAGAAVAGAPAGATSIPVGGPTTYTRAEIVELAFSTLGRPMPARRRVSPGVLRGVAALLRPLHPRLAAVMEFGAAVSVVDAVAPAYGTRELREWFRGEG